MPLLRRTIEYRAMRLLSALCLLSSLASLCASAEAESFLPGASAILPPMFQPFDQVATSIERSSIRVKDEGVMKRPMLLNRQLKTTERSEAIAADFIDAIDRIEGIHDPTRAGLFGPALRMKVRAGTASMNNVFADRWVRADVDPNIHYHVRFLAEAWLRTPSKICEYYKRARLGLSADGLDELAPSDCARIKMMRGDEDEPLLRGEAVASPLTLPVFASPYPGGRLSKEEYWRQREAELTEIRERLRSRAKTRL